jgi:hypothetical protein
MGPSLHLTGKEETWSPLQETPTSLAMYSLWAFVLWRSHLEGVGIDISTFVREELEQSHLLDAGWTEQTLLALFSMTSTMM